MSDDPMEAPEEDRGWSVRIIDLSGASDDDDGVVEVVKGFLDLPHANAFARAYVRDSLERCRQSGVTGREVLEAWYAFGEDAVVVDAGDDGWKSTTELDDFVAQPATAMERDWRAIDPRRLVDEDEFPDDLTDDRPEDPAEA
ncbi:hypothetical protein [Brytella acorum]|uniref:Uncharacterized protein n=1 Tax=Brytella acorum TaxID=2959299 RepID=A0AA35VBD8_9PROT|nr:hypothetical protein [Brytella acorum]MDF3624254.1 hypothetical protein [Brytella acorum]CAI9121172.1 hypothetical protein LMG32879_002018 [Brytella acorum]